MDEIQQLSQEASTGSHAQQLAADPILNAAFDEIRADFLNKWYESSPLQTELREGLFAAIKILDKVRAALVTRIETGKMASIQLVEAREKAARGRRPANAA